MYLHQFRKIPLRDKIRLSSRQQDLLSAVNIHTLYDLLTYYPFRYEDRTRIEEIQTSLLEQRPVSCIVTVTGHEYIYFNRKRHPKIKVQDEKTQAFLIGFNRFYLAKNLEIGEKYYLYTQFQYKYNEIQTSSFDFEKYDEEQDAGKFKQVLPVYRIPQKLKMKEIRSVFKKLLEKEDWIPDDELPPYLLSAHHLVGKAEAIRTIHLPEQTEDIKKAKLRLSFDSLFSLQLAVSLRRKLISTIEKNFPVADTRLAEQFLDALPFTPTGAQSRVIKEIREDILSPRPMHRLVQGDVGSGKTIVALSAACLVIANRAQCAFMAPTEVLARQHYQNAKQLLTPLGVKVTLLTGSIGNPDRQSILDDIKNGVSQLIIGTHALFQEEVLFKTLRLIIIDEQHKFGVQQRLALAQKSTHPDTLVMTATPIPRTMTLTLYGDLDVSIIDELPPGRQAISTQWIKDRSQYQQMLQHVSDEIDRGRQAYFIYPMIDESTDSEKKSAVQMFARLKKFFSNAKLGLIHGRLSQEEKEAVMQGFQENRIQILISTTVIEVGVDVSNATTMVIENADNFGLSQLHQLRGRVGRGKYASHCFLITHENDNPETRFRMETMIQHQDGFRIAEEDLRLRGPGEIMGTRQSGMPELRFSEYLLDEKLLLVAREDAQAILNKDPDLTRPENQVLREGIIDPLPHSYLHSG